MDDWFNGAPQLGAPTYSVNDIDSIRNSIFSSQYENLAKGFQRTNHHDDSKNAAAAAYNTNYANWELSKLDKLYDLQKMELEMQYNSAAAQKRRFMEAGINPYLAMSGTSNAGSVVAGGSPQSHGMSMPDLASASQAETADFNALTSSAGQLNDSVSSFYKNQIMNQQAQQEEFKTIHQAELYRTDLRNKIADLEGKKDKSDIDRQTLQALRLAYSKSLDTYYEDVQTPRLQNDLLRSQFAKTKSEQAFVDAQTKTEDLMRGIRYRAAEEGIKLSQAQSYQFYALASKLSMETNAIERELQYMNDFGYRFRGDKEYSETSISAENLKRLRETSESFLKECKNRGFISDEEYRQAVQRTQALTTQTYWDSYMHGQGDSFGTTVVGGLSMLTELFGNIFGGAMMRNIPK